MPRLLCPDCGKRLPAGAPAGMCPNCLLRLAAPVADDARRTVVERPGDPDVPSSPTEPAGACIGRYNLLERIGEGGFGTVWMAEQTEPVRRRVALKIIKLGMDTREVVARFEAERQALALMDHPNIARVLDGGATENGRPYFVMELVKGQRITDYCDVRRLSTGERLRICIKVCQAVQHAHQKGVIHRDLKPSNVLVTEQDGHPVAKVIDFGIAKAAGAELTDKTLFTRLNEVIGTPAYMSPEQAGLGSLDIDTRSDIYALGVMLYELLTGRPPFSDKELLKAGRDEILRVIREKEPPKPSTRLSTLAEAELAATARQRSSAPAKLNRLVRGELDWIVMKCLEKDRARRYESAGDLARDLERHLGNEPVLARPPSTLYRLQKAIRRNRTAWAAAASVVLVLVAGAVVSAGQAIRATQAEREQSRLLGRARAEEFKSRQVAGFLRSMLQGVRPQVSLGRDTTLLREIADTTAARVGQELQDQPAVAIELRIILGVVYRELLEFEKAEEMHRQALTQARTIGGPHPEVLTQALLALADTLSAEGKLSQAEPLLREGLEVRRKLADPTAFPELHGGLSELLRKERRLAEAEVLNREALEIWRQSPRSEGLARALVTLGGLLRDQRRWGEAESACREGLAICQRYYPSNFSMNAWLAGDLARVLEPQGKLAEAEFFYRTAYTNKCRAEPNNLVRFFPYQGLARTLRAQGRPAEAEVLLTEHLHAFRDTVGRGVVTYVSFEFLLNLAEVLDAQGKTNQTQALITEMMTTWPQARQRMSAEDQIEVLAMLGELLLDHRRFAEAQPLCREGLALWRQHQPARWHVRARLAKTLALSLRHLGEWSQAELAYLEAIAEGSRVWTSEPALWEPLLDGLTVVRRQLGRPVTIAALRQELQLPAAGRNEAQTSPPE